MKVPMESTGKKKDYLLFSSRGFSLTEVLVAIGIMAIMGAVALPSFVDWRKTLYYKQAAGDVVNALKYARSRAISRNQEHGVNFSGSYQFGRYSTNTWVNAGNKGFMSNVTKNVTLNLYSVGAATVPNIKFKIDGASYDNYSVCIRDATSKSKYIVSVTLSGRITSRRIP